MIGGATGLLLGAACGATVGGVALAWQGQLPLALSLLGGVGGGVAASALLGLLMPIGLRLLKRGANIALRNRKRRSGPLQPQIVADGRRQTVFAPVPRRQANLSRRAAPAPPSRR